MEVKCLDVVELYDLKGILIHLEAKQFETHTTPTLLLFSEVRGLNRMDAVSEEVLEFLHSRWCLVRELLGFLLSEFFPLHLPQPHYHTLHDRCLVEERAQVIGKGSFIFTESRECFQTLLILHAEVSSNPGFTHLIQKYRELLEVIEQCILLLLPELLDVTLLLVVGDLKQEFLSLLTVLVK